MINEKEIVLLDDNDDTNFYNKDVIEESQLFDDILVYTDPEELLDFIKDRLSSDEALPGVFLVDINMPEMDGFEFLDEFDELIGDTTQLPKVYILSTSSHKRDHEQYERSYLAAGYIVKKTFNLETLQGLFET